MPSYDFTQQVFSLNWLSNINVSRSDTYENQQAFAQRKIAEVLKDNEVIECIGEWEVVWGPVVYMHDVSTDNPNPTGVVDNLMYVARSKIDDGNPLYVVAIAGTNPDSWYGWFVEDFHVNQTVAWPYHKIPYLPFMQPRISKGTSQGLDILSSMRCKSGGTLTEFLASVTQNTDTLRVMVTGHSLGGALSASLALALVDTQGAGTLWPWDVERRAQVMALPSAGATPGNAAFSRHYDSALPRGLTTRLWNKLDIVPHAWQADMLLEIPGLYESAIPKDVLVSLLADLALAHSVLGNYRQLLPKTTPLPGSINEKLAQLTLLQIVEQVGLEAIKSWLKKILEHGKSRGRLNQAIADRLEKGLDDLAATAAAGGVSAEPANIAASLEQLIGKVDDKVLAATLLNFLRFMAQAGYQHVTAYVDLLKVEAFAERMKKIREA
jgi:hypothetical protein